jgi:hypothetical protein
LRNIGVRYIVVHRAFYSDDRYRELLLQIRGRPELRPNGKFTDPQGEARLFVLTQ